VPLVGYGAMIDPLNSRVARVTLERVERKLTTILAADVAGYSRPIGAYEEGTTRCLRALHTELIDR
jgi:hypothetical protein